MDRRSRDRFIESSAQIAALVDKFKVEGHEYRKFIPPSAAANGSAAAALNGAPGTIPHHHPPSIPLTAYGKASSFSITMALIGRQLSSTFTWKNLFRRILVLPLFFATLYLFILPRLDTKQQTFHTRSGLLFNCLAGITFLAPVITAYYFSCHRNRFYEESSRLSLYRGPLFIFTQILTSVPFSLITVWASASIIYWAAGLRYDPTSLDFITCFRVT